MNNRELSTCEAIEQRRFAYVWPANDCNIRQRVNVTH